MEQRPLRLGDIVDDYCPRERRITNHVIAAIVGDNIKQTRCSTCDAEHLYKGARVPQRKKKTDLASPETAVLASVNGTQLVARVDSSDTRSVAAKPAEIASADTARPAADMHAARVEPANGNVAPRQDQAAKPAQPADTADDEGPQPGNSVNDPLPGGWMGHRTLIRATLPKTDGELPPPRAIPEFTMHQRQTRGSHAFRGGEGWGGRGGSGGGGGGHRGFSSNGHERNGNVGGSFGSNGNGHGHSNNHGNGAPPGQGQPGQSRPPGQGGRRHRHGKNRRPPGPPR